MPGRCNGRAISLSLRAFFASDELRPRNLPNCHGTPIQRGRLLRTHQPWRAVPGKTVLAMTNRRDFDKALGATVLKRSARIMWAHIEKLGDTLWTSI